MSYFEELIEYKMAELRGNNTTVPKPRTNDLDALEVARIRALDKARHLSGRVQYYVQAIKAARGDAEYVLDPRNAPSRERFVRGIVKDAAQVEIRDGPKA